MFGYIGRLLFYILHLLVSTIFFLFALYLLCDLIYDELFPFFFLLTIILFHVVFLLIVPFSKFVEDLLPETFKPYIHSVCIKLQEFKLYVFKKATIVSYYIDVFLTHDSFIDIRIICKSLFVSLCLSFLIAGILIPAIKLHYKMYRIFLDKLGCSSFAI